ncbi:MAG TPA: molybdopterin-dependent oxidoreductase [Syntrophorhabdaceae bacterium]
MITVTIDGKEIQAEEGRTILEIARQNDIPIPTLCYHEHLLPIGSCRLCIVEIEGYDKPMASCDTVARDGISVVTRSDKLFAMRQEYLKFLLIHHPLECPICDAAGECRLQDLAFEHKLEQVDLSAEKEAKKAEPYSTSLIRYAESRCVLCLRCVHACREISGRTVLEIAQKGIQARMAPVNGLDCISCGECLAVCPVGALVERVSPLKSRKWQTRRVSTTCAHCGYGCGLTLDVYGDRVITKVLTDVDQMPNKGSLCIMGRFGYDFANNPALLKEAVIKEEGVAKTVSLQESVEAVAAGLSRLLKQGKPAGFIVSPRATNEEISMISQIAGCFPMSTIGTSGNYHTGKVRDVMDRMGIPPVYNYEDLAGCDLVIAAGADLLGNNHLLGNRVREAVKKNGSRVAVIDPSPTALTRIADSWLNITPGSDALLFQLIAKRLLTEKRYSPQGEKIEGFKELSAVVEKIDEAAALLECGTDKKAFERFMTLLTGAGRIAFIVGSGLSAREASLTSLFNVSLLLGLEDRCLVMATSLQSNAVGAAAILPNAVEAHRVVTNPGIGGLFIYEDDPFSYMNAAETEEALKQKAFIAVCDALPSKVADYAHAVIPTGTFAEKEGTCVAEDGFVRKVRRARSGSSQGYEFLRALVRKLCGGLNQSEKETTESLYKSGVLVKDGSGRERIAAGSSEKRFITDVGTSEVRGQRVCTLVLRNVFLSHHLADKNTYSKTVYVNNPPVAGDMLFISAEDGNALGIAEGDMVCLETDLATVTERASIRKGLKQGVAEYRMLTKRQEILKLARGYGKHIAVTMKKG